MTAKNHYSKTALPTPYIVILGTAQDGGYPQAGCNKECCKEAWFNPALRRLVTSIAIVDPITKDRWLFDITPDFKEQFHILEDLSPTLDKNILSGVFLTHGHTGHYTGLINFGREVMNTRDVKVYVMPGMFKFLKTNAPWCQLIEQGNIKLITLKNKTSLALNNRISIIPFLVPHRDEFTETAGFKITGLKNTVVFIPDIDRWDSNVIQIINTSDTALLDGTFYNKSELPERNINEIPHPLMVESMQVFKNFSVKNKIYFIHFNHTNPVLSPESKASKTVLENGFFLAQERQIIEL